MAKAWARARAWGLGLGLAAAWACLFALGGSAPVAAQPQQRDPFNGRFGAMELPMAPREAARQATLLGEALAALAPQRPGAADVYVLSASLWSDPVFEREASQAAEIMAQHFNAQGRTIVLSAGAGDAPRTFANSSPNNIMAALGKIGSLIDPAEDLVVVFLTSHGSPDGSAALREQDRLSGSLRPVHLRDALASAGVRNRVVIVSACFSGAFIAPLADPNTIVLTAAAPDRTSFGCQPENEWTYFGDAFFNQALREGQGLLEAYDAAKVQIERWERERGMSPPSNPQRYVGPRAAALVAQVERGAH